MSLLSLGKIPLFYPCLDWISLTTFSRDVFDSMVETAVSVVGERQWREQRIANYHGLTNGSIWHGGGIQKGRSHFRLQVSGSDARLLEQHLQWSLADINCTRIDIQLTIDLPDNYSADRVANDIHHGVWPDGRRRKVRKYVNMGDGLDTIYIGSPKSEKQIRLYVKQGENGRYLRFEAQYRGAAAEAVYLLIAEGKTGLALAGELHRMPQVWPFQLFREILPADGVAAAGAIYVPDDNRTWRWFQTQIVPAIKRMLNSHEYRQRMIYLLEYILRQAKGDMEK